MSISPASTETYQTFSHWYRLILLAIVISVKPISSVAGDEYKCQGTTGGISYSDQPCSTGSTDLNQRNRSVVAHYDLPPPDISIDELQGIWRDDPGDAFTLSWIFSGSQVTIATRLGYPSKLRFSIKDNLITFRSSNGGTTATPATVSEFSRHSMTLAWGDNPIILYRR